MSPILSRAGFSLGFGRRRNVGGGGLKGYEVLVQYINTSYSSPFSNSITLPANYNTPGSAIIVYGAAGGGGGAGGGGDDGFPGAGGGAAIGPGGYLITSGIVGAATISYVVGCGGASGQNQGSGGTNGGNSTVSISGSPVVILNGGTAGSNSGSVGNVPGGSSGGAYGSTGGAGGGGANRPGSISNSDGGGGLCGGGGGSGGHLSPYRAGKPGGSSSSNFTDTYVSGNFGSPIIILSTPASGAVANTSPPGTPGPYALSNSIPLAISGAGNHDINTGTAGGCGAGILFSINGTPLGYRSGGGGGANAAYASFVTTPGGPAPFANYGLGGGGCLIIIGRVGPA